MDLRLITSASFRVELEQLASARSARPVQRFQGLATRNFPPDLAQGEVLRVALQGREGVHPVAFDVKRVERLEGGGIQPTLKDGGQPGPFVGKGPAHHVLQKALARHDDAAVFQMLQEIPEQEDRLC